jgi:hypothetical protein
VAGELRRTAPFRDTVEHTNRSLPEVLDSQPKRKKDPSGEEFPLLVLRLVRARIARCRQLERREGSAMGLRRRAPRLALAARGVRRSFC